MNPEAPGSKFEGLGAVHGNHATGIGHSAIFSWKVVALLQRFNLSTAAMDPDHHKNSRPCHRRMLKVWPNVTRHDETGYKHVKSRNSFCSSWLFDHQCCEGKRRRLADDMQTEKACLIVL